MIQGMSRFFLFGLISTGGAAFDFIVVLLLMKADFSPALSLAFAMCVSATALYVIHQKITFVDIGGRDLRFSRLVAFLTNTAVVYGFRLLIFSVFSGFGINIPLALGLSLISSLALNYMVSRTLIFPKSETSPPNANCGELH